jgi:hypothetical protein
MQSLQVHTVTLKLIQAGSGDIDAYLKSHISDIHAWQSWFDLSPLSHNNKLRKAFTILPQKVVVECASQFAEQVLDIFEKDNPKDNCPRKAIEAARAWIANPNDKTAAQAAQAAHAAHAAAYAAAQAANAAAQAANAAAQAANAAYATAQAAHVAAQAANAAHVAANATYAAHVAANAAHVAANAANAATYAANAANAATYAANAATYAANAATYAANAATYAANRNAFESRQIEIVLGVIAHMGHYE